MSAPHNTKPLSAIERSRHILQELLQLIAQECGNEGSSAPADTNCVVTTLYLHPERTSSLRLYTGVPGKSDYPCCLKYCGLVIGKVRKDEEAGRELERLKQVFVTCPETGQLKIGPFLSETDKAGVAEPVMLELADQDERPTVETARAVFDTLFKVGLRGTLDQIYRGHLHSKMLEPVP